MTPPLAKEEVERLSPQVMRRRAWALRDVAAMLLRPEDDTKRGPSVCGCGRAGHEAQHVALHLTEAGTARTTGVFFCDSAWLCPVCAPKRAKARQERVALVYDIVQAFKGQTPMITITVRHRKGMSLAQVKAAVDAAFRKVRQGAPWKRAKEKYGIFGVLSAPEVTWSRAHGWHYHIHVGIPCQTSVAGARELGAWFIDRYLSYIRAEGFEALRKAQDVTVPASRDAAADYLAKGVTTSRDATWELAGAATKRGKYDNGMHPFDLLEAASGDPAMADLWREYAAAMKGVRSCVVNHHMAEKLGLEDFDDEDIPGEERADETPIGVLPSDLWNGLMRKMKASTVLAALEDGGAEAWPEVRRMAYDMMGWNFDHDMEGEALIVRVPVVREHRPTPEWVAQQAVAEATSRFRGRKGEAVRAILDRERGQAVAKGLAFVPPDLRRVLELVGA